MELFDKAVRRRDIFYLIFLTSKVSVLDDDADNYDDHGGEIFGGGGGGCGNCSCQGFKDRFLRFSLFQGPS